MGRTFPRVIDVHSHLFNQHHVPVEGVMKQKGVPAFLASVFAKLLRQLTPADTAQTKLPGQNYQAQVLAAANIADLGGLLAELANRNLSTTMAARFAAMAAMATPDARIGVRVLDEPSNQLLDVLEEIQSLYSASTKDPLPRLDRHAFIKAEFGVQVRNRPMNHAAMLHLKLANLFAKPVAWLVKEIASLILKDRYSDSLDFIRFFLLMLCSEDELCDTYLGSYRPDQNVERRLHLMMDMRYGYPNDPAPYYDYAKQVERMGRLTAAHSGKLLCFVAFDPRRGTVAGSGKPGLDIVKEALDSGFSGVKLYPPMGFRPDSDNPDQDRMLKELFAFCVDKDVPIMAHCTPLGAECRKRAGLNSNPEYWGNVLARTGCARLRLCYGHAGGGHFEVDGEAFEGWNAVDLAAWNADNNYARRIVEHCVTYENVYCDLSYHHEILEDPETRRRLAANLARAFEQKGPYPFRTKVMYGADWHMPSINRHAERYLDAMYDLFMGHPALKDHAEAFFSGNAKRFLKL